MKDMGNYISVEEAVKHLRGGAMEKYPASFCMGLLAAAGELKELPAADVRPVVRGEWKPHYTVSRGIKKQDGYDGSCCGRWVKVKTKFCPNCGADMKGGQDNG